MSGLLSWLLPSSPKNRAERDAADSAGLEAMRLRAADVESREGLLRGRARATVLAREELFRQQLQACIERLPATSVKAYKPKKKKPVERILNLLWSDLHFHSLLDPREVPVAYGPVEEARRLAALCVQAAEYKRDHRDETVLAINLAGDIIQGQLHDPRDGAPLAEQFAAALHLLDQAVTFLSTQFRRVDIRCTPGNHGRNTARHRERATLQKWDSIENMLYFALKTGCGRLSNVTIDVPYRPFYVYDSFGDKVFVTHGDTVFNPGNPGASIDVGRIQNQINKFNAPRKDSEKAKLFCVGHVHTGAVVQVGRDVTFMSNGALVPPDAYAGSIGIHDTRCGQQMWESVPGRVVGDSRFVDVDESTDADKSLDRVVRPFKGF